MKRRSVLVPAVGLVLLSLPAAAGSAPLSSSATPIAQLLCGCDLQRATRAVVTVGARVSTISMSIVHVVRGCHAWALGPRQLGSAATVDVKVGTRLKLRIDCPMDFDLTQVAGPKLALGGRRFYTGSTRVLVFRKAGVYKLVARNVQTSDEVGLETLGEDNIPRLIVRVR